MHSENERDAPDVKTAERVAEDTVSSTRRSDLVVITDKSGSLDRS